MNIAMPAMFLMTEISLHIKHVALYKVVTVCLVALKTVREILKSRAADFKRLATTA
jgi:hypothetical protein